VHAEHRQDELDDEDFPAAADYLSLLAPDLVRASRLGLL
jgi:hypothetical protein